MEHLKQRQEALLNEYKGNLFEFLTAKSLAEKLKLEASFLKSLDSDFLKMLNQQEQFVRQFYPKLLKELPILANHLSSKLIEKQKLDSILSIELVGKAAASQLSKFAEADIILKNSEKTIPISVKLNKYKAMTNTKSAGVKSFFHKYFNIAQEDLNQEIEKLFDHFTFALHEEVDLEPDKNFNNWVMDGRPQLPGQLDGRCREIYLELLHKLAGLFYNKLLVVAKGPSFIESIFPIIGFGQEDIIQAACFYTGDYQYKSAYTLSKNETKIDNFKFLNFNFDKSYFEIEFENLNLQIRIKAMNKFINKSFKVNCSVKMH